jgi:hypothetical protein
MARRNQIITTFIPIPTAEQQSAAFRLFYVQYRARIARIHLESAKYTEQRAAEGNEYRGAGRAVAQELITVDIAPAYMAEFFAEGATIHLINPKDAMPIYNDIHQHLRDWREYQRTRIHGAAVPEDDLRAMDAFAAAIYPYARHDIKQSGSDLLLARTGILPTSSLRRGGFSRFTAEQRAQNEAMARGTQDVPEQHNPLVDAILEPTKRKTKWMT